MKSYAIVRKSPPKTIQHVLKVQQQSPHVAINPIQQNETSSIRRDHREIPAHTIQRKSAHMNIQRTAIQPTRFSVSPFRRNRIFDHYEASRSRQKKDNLQNSLAGSVKKKQSGEALGMPMLYELISKQSEKKQRARVNAQKEASIATPQKNKEASEQSSPLDRLQQSSNLKSKAESSHYDSFQLHHEEQFSAQLTSQEYTRSIPTRAIEGNSSIYQKQTTKTKQNRILANTSDIQVIDNKSRFERKVSEKSSELSGSVVNIGCCGEDLQTEQTIKEEEYVFKTAYGRNQVQNNLNRSIDEPKVDHDMADRVSFNQSFHQNKPDYSTRPFHRKIFAQFNPQSQSSKVMEIQSYKEDKINSKPLMDRFQRSTSKKSHQVTVFQIRSFEPFVF